MWFFLPTFSFSSRVSLVFSNAFSASVFSSIALWASCKKIRQNKNCSIFGAQWLEISNCMKFFTFICDIESIRFVSYNLILTVFTQNGGRGGSEGGKREFLKLGGDFEGEFIPPLEKNPPLRGG